MRNQTTDVELRSTGPKEHSAAIHTQRDATKQHSTAQHRTAQHIAAGCSLAEGNATICAIYTQNVSFYQDRLGTNIGTTQNKRGVSSP